MYVNAGYFGTALLEYGACHIGREIWIKHGLTEEDKEAFETYQNRCEELSSASIDDSVWFTNAIDEIVAYESATSSEKRAKIVEIIMEVDEQYEIGNWKSCIFEEQELGVGLGLDSDEIDNLPACLVMRDEEYIEWRRTKIMQLLTEEEDLDTNKESDEEEEISMKCSIDEAEWNAAWAEAYEEEQKIKDWCEREKDVEQDLEENGDEEHAMEEEEDLEDWYERQREIRYAHAIENLRDQMHDSY
jgi:hypothetical protein